jgi:hypothetical protein
MSHIEGPQFTPDLRENAHYSDKDLDNIVRAAGGIPPDGPSIRFRRYTPETALDIAKTSRQAALSKSLEEAALIWVNEKHFSEEVAASGRRNRFVNIVSSAQRLLDQFDFESEKQGDVAHRFVLADLQSLANLHAESIGGFPDCPPVTFTMNGSTYQDWRGPDKVALAIDAVRLLRDWAAKAQERYISQVSPNNRDRHKGNEPLDGLFFRLLAIWTEIFDRSIRTSVGAQGSQNEGEATGPLIAFVTAALEPLGLSLGTDAVRARIRRLIQRSVKSNLPEI